MLHRHYLATIKDQTHPPPLTSKTDCGSREEKISNHEAQRAIHGSLFYHTIIATIDYPLLTSDVYMDFSWICHLSLSCLSAGRK